MESLKLLLSIILLLFINLFLMTAFLDAQNALDWENPTIFSRNTEPPHCTLIPFPDEWKEREVVLHFGAVKSAFYLWINGIQVGYSQGSKTPAEFRITDDLRKGENKVSAEVYRWCEGSYLEDQDFWRLSGIEREVYLFATPVVHVRDFFIRAGLTNN